jgi:hypothetical protein
MRSAQRQEAVQLQGILTQQKEIEVRQEQQAAAALEQQLAAERALPFFGKDLLNLSAHVRGEEKQLFERLRDNYAGDTRRWYAAEGQSWMAGAAARLQKAPFYQQATQNRAAVLAAQQAITEGKHIVGTTAADGYRTGEQQLQDFLSGRSNTFSFNGSYAPDDDLKELRNTLPSARLPFERVAVSEEEKLAHLINVHGEEVGTSKYFRQHRNVPTFFKTLPLTEAVKFGQDNVRFGMEQGRYGMEQGRYRMAQQDQAMQRAMFGLQAEGQQLSNAKKRQELSGVGANGLPFDYDLLAHPSETVALKHDPANNHKLPSGIDVSKMKSLAGVTLFGGADEVLAKQLGMSRTKDGYTRGNIKEGFSEANGVNAFSLAGADFEVVGLSPTLYYSPADVLPNGMLNPNGVRGYARITAKFSTPDAAAKAGLYNPNRLPLTSRTDKTGIFDSETKSGVAVYNPETKQASFFVPVGYIDGRLNKPMVKQIQKSVMGQKEANESFDAPYTPRPNY